MNNKLLAFTVAVLSWSVYSTAQTAPENLPDALKSKWGVFIFVSTKMPRDSLIQIARDAALANATLVLRGFPTKPGDLGAYQQYVSEINRSCCGKAVPQWEIHPKLFEVYGITETPAFVLANEQTSDFTKVMGNMRLGAALKYIAQQSRTVRTKEVARQIYDTSFVGKE